MMCIFLTLQPQKSSGNPFLKILDFSQPFITDAPMKKKSENVVSPPPPSQNTFGAPSTKIIFIHASIKNTILHTLVKIIFIYHLKK